MSNKPHLFEGRDANLEKAIMAAQHKAAQGVPSERVTCKVVDIEFARGGIVDGPEFTVHVTRVG
jgi:hypothetical protein